MYHALKYDRIKNRRFIIIMKVYSPGVPPGREAVAAGRRARRGPAPPTGNRRSQTHDNPPERQRYSIIHI